MPLPSWLARFNRSVTNHVTRPLIALTPSGAIVVHRGRRSGRSYRTPVLAFPLDDGYVIALTYGPNVDWLKNVIAAGSCRLEHGKRSVTLTQPVMLQGDAALVGLPTTVRWILRRIGVTEAVRLRHEG